MSQLDASAESGTRKPLHEETSMRNFAIFSPLWLNSIVTDSAFILFESEFHRFQALAEIYPLVPNN